MNIAFVDSLQVGGGLSRFSYMLCKSLLDYNPDIRVDYFVHVENLARTPELNSLSGRINIMPLASTRVNGRLHRLANKVIETAFPAKTSGEDVVQKEIETKVKGYDLAYFPSAHMMSKPDLPLPIVGTIHDFNWKYFFGREIFSEAFVRKMDVDILSWLNDAYTISSSAYVIEEARKLYPAQQRLPEVVHIAPVLFNNNIEKNTQQQILNDLDINYPYIIFPGNFFPHKNHLNLFSAVSKLFDKKEFSSYKLLLTGMHTDKVGYGVAENCGIRLLPGYRKGEHFNVRGLGYLPNIKVDTLIHNAALLVSPSIYEAICTPAMDAWFYGRPTAISDIKPFREHEQVWGVRSAFFDPMDPKNICDTIASYLTNYTAALEDGKVSQQNILKYTWQHVAEGYRKVFERAINVYA